MGIWYIITMKVIISDTHFGIRQNSLTWLKSQEDFVYNQLIPFMMSTSEFITLVHLGDVFDSRSSVSTYVASRVIKMFDTLKKIANEVIVVSGNHDFYSPNSDEVDTNTLLLKQIGITVVSNDVYVNGKDLYVPWYMWFEQDYLQSVIDKYYITNVFTHADLVTEPVKISGPRIFSGHIHTPNFNGKLMTLGSTYPLTFADANQERGFYVLDEKGLNFYPNTKSIRFWKFSDIPTEKVSQFDYINLYISKSNLQNEEYMSRLKDWIKDKRNCQVFPIDDTQSSNIDVSDTNYNITDICKDLIPDYLKDKFLKITVE
jgi:DNA repair exonuclease SbcCD nuclease subunit